MLMPSHAAEKKLSCFSLYGQTPHGTNWANTTGEFYTKSRKDKALQHKKRPRMLLVDTNRVAVAHLIASKSRRTERYRMLLQKELQPLGAAFKTTKQNPPHAVKNTGDHVQKL